MSAFWVAYGKGENNPAPVSSLHRPDRLCVPDAGYLVLVSGSNHLRCIVSFHPRVRMRYVTAKDVTLFDPNLHSFGIVQE